HSRVLRNYKFARAFALMLSYCSFKAIDWGTCCSARCEKKTPSLNAKALYRCAVLLSTEIVLCWKKSGCQCVESRKWILQQRTRRGGPVAAGCVSRWNAGSAAVLVGTGIHCANGFAAFSASGMNILEDRRKRERAVAARSHSFTSGRRSGCQVVIVVGLVHKERIAGEVAALQCAGLVGLRARSGEDVVTNHGRIG